MTFTFNGEQLAYARDAYNDTALNERTVEIPIARRFIAEYGMDLEVGNVLRNYGHTDHKVIDRYDEDPHVTQLDVFDIPSPQGTVVAISTLEHVRWEEPNRDTDGAIRALKHLIDVSERLFVTVPMGYHPALDTHLLYGEHGATFTATMVRCPEGWRQTCRPAWRRYALSTQWAESVWIGWWL